MNNEHAEGNGHQAKTHNYIFISHTKVDDTSKTLPNIERTDYSLDSIVITVQDVKDVLLNLNATKACGPDLLSPRFLKEGAEILAAHLRLSLIIKAMFFSCSMERRKRITDP